MEKLRFGQVWKWKDMPQVPLMYVGEMKGDRTGESHWMAHLVGNADTTIASSWGTIRTLPKNWTLLEDVDDDQEG